MTDNGDTITALSAAPLGPPIARPDPATAAAAVRQRLGEELPVFCERCGYSLHGLPQNRCDACRVLHFACPECGHHQPINTLRPAVQRVLGRLRALGLAVVVFLKINYFFWFLFAFGGVSTEISYRYNYYRNPVAPTGPTTSGYTYVKVAAPYEGESAVAIFIMGFVFAMIARMLLLRWPRGVLVGATLAGLVVLAMLIGAHFEQMTYHEPLPSPLSFGFFAYMFSAACGVMAGAVSVWGIWLALTHAFLPRRVAESLIAWQRGMSEDNPTRQNNPDAAMSVTS